MKRMTVAIIAGLLLFSLACASLGGGSKETETPVVTQETGGGAQEPTQQTPEVATPDVAPDESAPPEVSDDALKGLDSYRTTMTIRTEYDSGEVEELSLRQEYIREPFATRMVMQTIGGDDDDMGQIETIQVGTTQWINFGGQWMQSEATDDGSGFGEDTMINYSDITTGLGPDDYKYVGRETVNGIKTKHYRLEVPAAEALALGSNITEASSEVWIADESGLPAFTVRMVITYKGELETGKPGTGTITQEVFDVNVAFTIEPPAEALAGGLPEDVPMYPGSTEVTAIGGMVSFQAPDDAATVTAFYDGALADNGWEKDAEAYIPSWSKEGRQLTLYVSDEDEGGSSVVIMIEVQE